MKNLILFTLLILSTFVYGQDQDSYYFNRKVNAQEDVQKDFFLTTPNDEHGNYTIKLVDQVNNIVFQYKVVEFSNTTVGGIEFLLIDELGNNFILRLNPGIDKMAIKNLITKEITIYIREKTYIQRI